MARMKTSRALLKTLPALLVAIGVFGADAHRAAAQEVQLTGPLKGAPAVRRLRLYRQGRFEVAPSFTATLLDEYRRTLLVGARLNYGITDWLSIGVWGAAQAVGVSTGLSDQIDSTAKRDGLTVMNVPGAQGDGEFQKQVAQLSYITMGQVTAVPFRGKFALFQSVFADVDAYLFIGGGYVGTKERKDCLSFIECAKNHDLESKGHVAPTWGLGFNFYMNKFIGLGVEYRMIPFAWNRSGFDSRGASGPPGSRDSGSGKFPDQRVTDEDATYRFNQMMSIFLSFSFPTVPKTTD